MILMSQFADWRSPEDFVSVNSTLKNARSVTDLVSIEEEQAKNTVRQATLNLVWIRL